MKLSLMNYVTFNIGWLACVMWAANGRPFVGLVVASLLIVLHLALATRPRTEARLLLYCAVIGTVFDSLLLATGWVSYPNGEWLPGLAPFWIIAIWVLFASTLNLSMAWLKGRTYLAVILGAIGGPLSYIAGEKLNAISLDQPVPALAMLAIGWAFMMPVLSSMAQRMNGFEQVTGSRAPASVDWPGQGVNENA